MVWPVVSNASALHHRQLSDKARPISRRPAHHLISATLEYSREGTDSSRAHQFYDALVKDWKASVRLFRSAADECVFGSAATHLGRHDVAQTLQELSYGDAVPADVGDEPMESPGFRGPQ